MPSKKLKYTAYKLTTDNKWLENSFNLTNKPNENFERLAAYLVDDIHSEDILVILLFVKQSKGYKLIAYTYSNYVRPGVILEPIKLESSKEIFESLNSVILFKLLKDEIGVETEEGTKGLNLEYLKI